jgi:DNA invertase Pin-like site-specific DNA recombinase
MRPNRTGDGGNGKQGQLCLLRNNCAGTAAGAHIKALDDPWLDTSTPHGELILTVMGGLQEFELKLIRQRCDEGIKRALARGTVFGRKPVLDAGERRKIAERYAAGETMAALARDYECGEATIWRALRGKSAG